MNYPSGRNCSFVGGTVLLLGISAGMLVIPKAGMPVLSRSLARVDGYVLSVDKPERRLKAMPGDNVEVEFQVTNIASDTVTIVGVQTGCGCTGIEPIPMQLLPGEEKTLYFTFSLLGREAGTVFQIVPRILVNVPSTPTFLDVKIDIQDEREK